MPAQQKYTYSFSSVSAAILTFPWVVYLINSWGYVPYQGAGIVMIFAIILAAVLLVAALDYALYRLGLQSPLRSRLWYLLSFWPLVSFAAQSTWHNPALSLALGILVAAAACILGIYLSRRQAGDRLSGGQPAVGHPPAATRSPRDPQARRTLTAILSEVPGARWAALVSPDSLLLDAYPPVTAPSPDRQAAMSAAMQSIGERIARELTLGAYQSTIISGADGLVIALRLAEKGILAVSLSQPTSLDNAMEQLKKY